MNFRNDSTRELLLQELTTWSCDIFERIFLGWCLNTLNSSHVANLLLVVDESWFVDEKRRMVYSAAVACVLEASAQRDSFLSTISVESAAYNLAIENGDQLEKGWAENTILDCCAQANRYVIGRDLIKSEIVARWKIVLGRPRVKQILDQTLDELSHEKFNPGDTSKVTDLLSKANHEWYRANFGVADDHELTEEEFFEQILVPLPDESVSISTGLDAFDQIAAGGIAKEFIGAGENKAINTEAGRIITIGARPGCGKTALMVSMIHGIAQSGGKGIVYTLEVPIAQVYARATAVHDFKLQIAGRGAIVDGVRTTQFGRRNFTDHQRDRIASYRGKTLPGIIIKERLRSIDQIVANARLSKRRDPDLRLIAIDHLGCISRSSNVNPHIAITEFMQKLLELVNEIKIDVILLCQLNRGLATRSDKRPTLVDFRESGSIEEFSHIVIGLHREENESAQEAQEIEVIALKNRNGPIGLKKAMFYKRYGVISDVQISEGREK